jgi:hypothetical protein
MQRGEGEKSEREKHLMADKALQPIDQKTVDFYGDELSAVLLEDGAIYVSIAHMCDALGVDTQGQTRRIKRNEVLEDGYTWVDILSTQPNPQRRRSQVLRLDLVPLFLTGISTKAVKDEIRAKLKRFQREAARVLWQAFQEGRLTADPSFSELLQADTPAVQAYRVLQQLTVLARNQVLLEARLGDHALLIGDLDRRLEQVEDILGDEGRHVTPDQASQISQAVKTVAMKLSKQSGRNEYGGVYGELYRKFGITSYKQLPVAKFDEAMAWLNEWRESIEGEVPF